VPVPLAAYGVGSSGVADAGVLAVLTPASLARPKPGGGEARPQFLDRVRERVETAPPEPAADDPFAGIGMTAPDARMGSLEFSVGGGGNGTARGDGDGPPAVTPP
jgi:hypothetical protein